jgi:hypothetical protein
VGGAGFQLQASESDVTFAGVIVVAAAFVDECVGVLR